MCLAVSWSSVCPELRGAGRPPALGDAGSPRTLTAPNLLLLFMALCCFLVPQLSSVSFQPRRCHLCSRLFGSHALLGGPLSLPSARASLQQLASQYQSLRQGRRVLARPPSQRAHPAWLAEGCRKPCPSSVFDSFPTNSPEDSLLHGHILSVWAGKASVWEPGTERQDPPLPPLPPQRSCASLFCCCSAFPDERGSRHTDMGIFVLLLLCH